MFRSVKILLRHHDSLLEEVLVDRNAVLLWHQHPDQNMENNFRLTKNRTVHIGKFCFESGPAHSGKFEALLTNKMSFSGENYCAYMRFYFSTLKVSVECLHKHQILSR